MSQIFLDANFSSKLNGLTSPVELCDDSGRVLGRFIPGQDPSNAIPEAPPMSAEELQRRRQEPDYSTAEVLAFLEKL